MKAEKGDLVEIPQDIFQSLDPFIQAIYQVLIDERKAVIVKSIHGVIPEGAVR